MSFRSEQELVELFKKSYSPNFDLSRNFLILEEVSLGFGIADLVITEKKDTPNYSTREKLTSIDINVYQIIKSKKRITFDAIASTTRAKKQNIAQALERLIQGCFIQKIDSYYVFTHKYELSFNKSIAIEAKLRNWKKALTQAYRYKWFADFSYVVLDYDHSRPALKDIHMFKNFNVGLITISSNGNVMSHYHPQKQSPIDPTMQMLLSEIILYS